MFADVSKDIHSCTVGSLAWQLIERRRENVNCYLCMLFIEVADMKTL